MNAVIKEWVEIAEADFFTAERMRRSRKKFTREVVCFHLQQCIEKYLKARLVDASLAFPKTHDLELLLDLVVTVEPLWSSMRPALTALKNFAVLSRYPGSGGPVSSKDANSIFKDARTIRKIIRGSLGLS